MTIRNPEGHIDTIRIEASEVDWLEQGLESIVAGKLVGKYIDTEDIDTSTPAGKLLKAVRVHAAESTERTAYSKEGGTVGALDIHLSYAPTALEAFKAVVKWAEADEVVLEDDSTYRFGESKYWRQDGQPVCQRAIEQLETT